MNFKLYHFNNKTYNILKTKFNLTIKKIKIFIQILIMYVKKLKMKKNIYLINQKVNKKFNQL